MGGAERGRTGVLAVIVSVTAISAAISGFATLGFAREPAQSTQECYRDDFGGRRYNNAFENISTDDLRTIIGNCVARAGDTARPTGETIYANFYVGKARRVLAAKEQRTASDPLWRDAEKALRLVTDFTGPRATVRSTQPELRFELTRIEAEIELAQALASQNKKQDAVLLAQQAISEYVAFPINPAFPALREQANAGSVNASYVLATIYRTVPPSNDVDALIALHAFVDARTDNHPRAADARADIVRTATALGLSRLEKGGEDLTTAQSYFTEALNAANAAYRVSPQSTDLRQSIADSYINLGRVNLKYVGRLGPEAIGGCEPVADLSKVAEATAQFTNAQAYAVSQQGQSIALQWKGCAELAGNNPAAAVQSFQLAANADSRSYSTQLSLARALYRAAANESGGDIAGSWRDARRSYENALSLMESNPATRSDSALKSKVRVEVADVDLAYLAWPGIPAAEKPRVISHAVANLKAATGLAPTQADAYLRLGQIQLGEGDFARELNLDGADGAGASLAKALQYARENTQLRGEAYYLLSRLEVRKFETQRGTVNRRAAITNADRATELGDDQRGPIYFAQACEARLVFGMADGAGTQFCVANESRDGANYPVALLHEGMYFLSKAKTSRTSIEQSGDWESALLAFSKGERYMQERGQVEWTQLRARLVTGRGLALGCSGLRTIGLDAIVSVPVNLAVEAREFFDRYGVKVCAAPRRN